MKLIITYLFIAFCSVRLFGDVDISALEARATAGDASAQNELGAYYQEGAKVPKDEARALSLYQHAADAGHPVAAYNLAFMYDMGLSVAKDRSTANTWYRKSAEAGYPPAMLNLGMNVAGGDGVAQDFVEGMMWIDLARFFTQHTSDKDMKYRIRGAYDYLRKRMTDPQFREAQARSKAWWEQFKAKQQNKAPQNSSPAKQAEEPSATKNDASTNSLFGR